MPLGNLVLSKTRLLILVQFIFQLPKQVLYEFSVASRHKARDTRFTTGIARRMFMPCRSRFGLTKLQTNWNIFLEIRKCSRQIKRINTLIKRRSEDAHASFVGISRHYSNWFSCAAALLKLLKSHSWKHLSFLSRLTMSVNKAHSGMLSETIGVVKTRPL